MKVLIVDDESTLCFALEQLVTSLGHEACAAATLADARRRLERGPVDLVLLDIRLPDGDGLTLLDELQERAAPPPVLVMTAHGGLDVAVQAMQRGAFDYLVKPVELDRVRQVLRRAADEARGDGPARTEPPSPPADSETPLIGSSRAIQEVFKQIGRVAGRPVTVLIEGESGTGKELVARALHGAGPSAAGPFEPINCAALPAELVESELFGHAAGAFTGADRRREGRIARAAGGTLFLDEISELPLSAQAKLLRFLAEGEIAPVGGSELRRVKTRVLAATNRSLTRDVAAGRFRADLFYRLNVVSIRVPPLRDRLDDLDLLLAHFGAMTGRELIWDRVIERLRASPWPGNVRQLRNLVEHVAAVAPGRIVRAEDLPTGLDGTAGGAEAEETMAARLQRCLAEGGEGRAWEVLVGDFERALATEAVRRCEGSRSAAARMLGVSRATLRKRLPDSD